MSDMFGPNLVKHIQNAGKSTPAPSGRKRSPERAQFLADVLTTAIEHSGYGFPGVIEYIWDVPNPADAYAVIIDRYEEDNGTRSERWRVTVDTIAKGFGIVRKKYGSDVQAGSNLADLLLADRTNGDDGDVDVIGALAVLECALFGEITYG